MHFARKTRVLLAGLLVFVLPAAANAQSSDFSVDLHGGISVGLGSLGDLTSSAGGYGAGLAWHFSPNVSVRGDFMVNMLDNGLADSGLLLSPPVDLTYFGGGVEVNFRSPRYQDQPLTFSANVGAGVTNVDVDETFSAINPANGIDASYFTLTFGGQVGFQAIRTGGAKLNLFVKAQPYFIFADGNDMLPYSQLLGSDPIDSLWVLSLTVGARISFGGD